MLASMGFGHSEANLALGCIHPFQLSGDVFHVLIKLLKISEISV